MLAPVGNPVTLIPTDDELPGFPGYHAIYLNSGTSSLALSLILAKIKSCRDKAEAIIPAYGCPDLVSACVSANIIPVVCDIGKDDPGYDLQMLESLISENTVAIIAVNFLGIRENLDEIRSLIGDRDISLVEDDAQWFPGSRDQDLMKGDLVVLSFGRGKPVSLLGGGAVLIRNNFLQLKEYDIEKFIGTSSNSVFGKIGYLLTLVIYNFLLQPSLYSIVCNIPGTGIGETRYYAPRDIEYLSPSIHKLLAINIRNYLTIGNNVENYYKNSIDAQLKGVVNLPNTLGHRTGKLLRYPLVFSNKKDRDLVVDRLNRHGLGASIMYKQPLWKIKDIPPVILIKREMKNAVQFADTLLTLPVHAYVREKHQRLIMDIMKSNIES